MLCKNCPYYVPKARYQSEMNNPKLRECIHKQICSRAYKIGSQFVTKSLFETEKSSDK